VHSSSIARLALPRENRPEAIFTDAKFVMTKSVFKREKGERTRDKFTFARESLEMLVERKGRLMFSKTVYNMPIIRLSIFP
jgi:hypothetical protein